MNCNLSERAVFHGWLCSCTDADQRIRERNLKIILTDDIQLGRLEQRLAQQNLTNAGTWRAPVDELIRIGPLNVRVRIPADIRGNRVQLLVSKRST
jgi:hypothetical protein